MNILSGSYQGTISLQPTATSTAQGSWCSQERSLVLLSRYFNDMSQVQIGLIGWDLVANLGKQRRLGEKLVVRLLTLGTWSNDSNGDAYRSMPWKLSPFFFVYFCLSGVTKFTGQQCQQCSEHGWSCRSSTITAGLSLLLDLHIVNFELGHAQRHTKATSHAQKNLDVIESPWRSGVYWRCHSFCLWGSLAQSNACRCREPQGAA